MTQEDSRDTSRHQGHRTPGIFNKRITGTQKDIKDIRGNKRTHKKIKLRKKIVEKSKRKKLVEKMREKKI